MNYLQRYQQQLGLKPDGVLGPKTAAAMMQDLGITDKLVFAHLIGQIAHESGQYKNFREDMNYSKAGLLDIFRRYYKNKPGLALRHAHKPKLIGNFVYALRNGNGDEASGDGYKYRGAFGLQLTGKKNFQAFFNYAGLPLDTDPDSLKDDPRMYFLAGKFWFEHNGADKLCTGATDACILRVSRKVNLGNENNVSLPHGLDDRSQRTRAAFKAVGLA